MGLRHSQQASAAATPEVNIVNGMTPLLQRDTKEKEEQKQLHKQKENQLAHISRSPQSHLYWFNKNHPTTFVISFDRQWNYCDYKCLYLQKYNSNKDFVVVVMNGFMKQQFSACYVKNGKDYTLWNQITTNKFYEENCGQDYKDWMKDSEFNVKGIYGQGIGTPLDVEAMYK